MGQPPCRNQRSKRHPVFLIIEEMRGSVNDMPEDLKEIVLEIGSQMIKLAGLGDDIEENKENMLKTIEKGFAYKKFKEMVKNQGGDISYLENPDKFPKASYKFEVKSSREGIVQEINAEDIGKVACFLGAGRVKKEDKIDMTAGIILNKKVHDFVQEEDCLCEVYCNNETKGLEAIKILEEIFKIG